MAVTGHRAFQVRRLEHAVAAEITDMMSAVAHACHLQALQEGLGAHLGLVFRDANHSEQKGIQPPFRRARTHPRLRFAISASEIVE